MLQTARQLKVVMTSEVIIANLQQAAHEDQSLANKPTTAMAAHAPLSAKNATNKPTCQNPNCGKPGHTMQNCWAQGGGKEGQRPSSRGRGGCNRGRQGPGSSRSSASANTATTGGNWAFVVATDFTLAAGTNLHPNQHTHLIDSGATRHFEPNRANFSSFQEIAPVPITSADGCQFYATGKGDIPIQATEGTRNVTITLKNALYAPEMPLTLISVSRMLAAGFHVRFKPQKGAQIIAPTGETIVSIAQDQGLFPLRGVTPESEHANSATTPKTKLTLMEFHRCMGHAGTKALLEMVKKGVVTGIEITDTTVDFCEACVEAKITTTPFPQKSNSQPTAAYGERIHSDIWGPARTKSLGGAHYYVSFIDDYTDEATIRFMPRKSDTLAKYLDFKAWAEAQRGARVIKTLQSDRGGEYLSKEFSDHLAHKGTER
jgi:hypothetical protein